MFVSLLACYVAFVHACEHNVLLQLENVLDDEGSVFNYYLKVLRNGFGVTHLKQALSLLVFPSSFLFCVLFSFN